MGHHSKKKNKNSASQPSPQPNLNNLGQFFNNIDINSMSNILNSMDINQVMSVLSKSFTPPTADPTQNKTSSDTDKNEGSDTTKDPKSNLFDSIPVPPQGNFDPVLPSNDPAVMVLNSLKPFLPPDKCMIIDNMVQLLGIKAVIDKIFPPASQAKNIEKNNTKPDENKTDDNNPSEIENAK